MKKVIFAIFIISMLSLVGCSGQKDTGTSNLKDPFIGGSDGVVINFEEDAPPSEVYDGGEFPFGIVVELKNEGEHKVAKEDAHVTISGIFASEFGKEEADLKATPTEDLDEMKKDSEGDIVDSNPVYVEFDDFNYLNKLAGNTAFTIRANVCYKYGTSAVSKICIKEEVYDTDESVCTVVENKEVYSSGAPVKIKDFQETRKAKDKVGFSFFVSHEGTGKIYQHDSECEHTRANEDKVWVEVVSGIDGLVCTGLSDGTDTSGYLTLYGNDRKVLCTQTVESNSDYEKTVDIKLSYDYEDYEEKEIIVKHSLD